MIEKMKRMQIKERLRNRKWKKIEKTKRKLKIVVEKQQIVYICKMSMISL